MNTVVITGLVLLVATWNCWISFKNGYAGLLVFRKCSSELAELVPLPNSEVRSTLFSVTIPRCYKDVYVNSFFPCRARLWNSLPIECFL